MKLHKLSHHNKKEIISAIKRGEKWLWIQREYNCSSSTITNFRRELGLYNNMQCLTAEQQKEIALKRCNASLKELSKEYGVSVSRISYICLKLAN